MRMRETVGAVFAQSYRHCLRGGYRSFETLHVQPFTDGWEGSVQKAKLVLPRSGPHQI